MRQSRFGWFPLAAIPSPAYPNAGIGLLAPSLLVTIPALLPAIAIEAVVYARMLRMPPWRALGTSAWANFISTLLGGALALAFDVALIGGGPEPGLAVVLASLVPMFLLSWWVERFFVRRMTAEDQLPRVARATLVANATTYALMALAVCAIVPIASQSVSPLKVREGIVLLYAAKADVAEYYARNQSFPPPRAVAIKSRYVRSAALERDGRLVVVFTFPSSPAADGRRVVLDPRVQGEKVVGWTCSTPDMPLKYLSADCRQEPAAAR